MPLEPGRSLPRHDSGAASYRRLVVGTNAPITVLVDQRDECLYVMRSTAIYLKGARRRLRDDPLAAARPAIRAKLRVVIQIANRKHVRFVTPGWRLRRASAFNTHISPVINAREAFVEASFIGRPARIRAPRRRRSTDDYLAVIEEILPDNEKSQPKSGDISTIDEQLRGTIEHRTALINDLLGIFQSTGVEILLLNSELFTSFFKPSMRKVFRMTSGDVERPLTNMASPTVESAVIDHIKTALRAYIQLEREIEAQQGSWFRRRVLPRRTDRGGIEGVVITVNDITKQKRGLRALEGAKQQPERPDVATSRLLATIAHDLRQPLQTLTVAQELLAPHIEGAQGKKLLARMDKALGTVVGMLNTMAEFACGYEETDGVAVVPTEKGHRPKRTPGAGGSLNLQRSSSRRS